MLRAGEQVPRFHVRTLDGRLVAYRTIWQRRFLLLVAVRRSPSQAERVLLSELEAHHADLTAHDTALVVTGDPIPGLEPPAVLIADRWGEIQHVAGPVRSEADLPDATALVDWLRYVQSQCPECQGETR
jgi:hypothetical protein